MTRHSFNLFNSTSCWVIVLLHAFRAVLLNSASAFVTLTLEDLCLPDVVGNLGTWGSEGGFESLPDGWITFGLEPGVWTVSELAKCWAGPDIP